MSAEIEVVSVIGGDRQAAHRADVDARVALDAQAGREIGLNVTVQAALYFTSGFFRAEPELDFHVQTEKALRELGVLHLRAWRRAVIVAVAPRMHADLGAHEVHAVRRPIRERDTLAVIVNRDRRLMAVLYGPDDVLRSPRRVAAEEDAWVVALHGRLVDNRHSVGVEVDADVALDPRKGVLLTDRENDVVARDDDRLDHFTLLPAALLIPAQLLELETYQPAILQHEPLWRVVLYNLHAFFFRVL